MSKEDNTALGCASILLFGVVAYIWSKSTTWGVISAIVVLWLIGQHGRSGRCDLCGNLLKQSHYVWRLKGWKRKVCSHCNDTLEREQSRRAIGRYKT